MFEEECRAMFVGKSAKVEYLQILLERQSTEGRDKALQQAITAYIEENGKQENKWISDGNSLIYHSIGKYQAHAPILHKMPLSPPSCPFTLSRQ